MENIYFRELGKFVAENGRLPEFKDINEYGSFLAFIMRGNALIGYIYFGNDDEKNVKDMGEKVKKFERIHKREPKFQENEVELYVYKRFIDAMHSKYCSKEK